MNRSKRRQNRRVMIKQMKEVKLKELIRIRKMIKRKIRNVVRLLSKRRTQR